VKPFVSLPLVAGPATGRVFLAFLMTSGSGGVRCWQYMHIPNREKCNWLRERIETSQIEEFSKKKKLHILDRLAWSEMFESFLANKYAAAKRFGLEGADTLIPGMKAMIDHASDLGVESVCIGMPHRGAEGGLDGVLLWDSWCVRLAVPFFPGRPRRGGRLVDACGGALRHSLSPG
jgi:hypothetical protein